jgi:hypothetical protein
MTVLWRQGFVSSLEEAIYWYNSQEEHGTKAADALTERFADAVDPTIVHITRRPNGGAPWIYREGYRYRSVEGPFKRWLLFYRIPLENTVELVDIVRGEHDLQLHVR